MQIKAENIIMTMISIRVSGFQEKEEENIDFGILQ